MKTKTPWMTRRIAQNKYETKGGLKVDAKEDVSQISLLSYLSLSPTLVSELNII